MRHRHLKPCFLLASLLIILCSAIVGMDFPPLLNRHSDSAVNTGISALETQHCWYDDTHLIVLEQGWTPRGDWEQTAGLFVLNVTKPRELTRLNLDPLPQDIQRQLTGLSCQNDKIMFYRYLPGRQVREIYTMSLSSAPERLAELRGVANLRGQYLIGSNRKVVNDSGPEQGTFEGTDDCAVRYVTPGFQVICTNSFGRPLTRFILDRYQWYDTIKARTEQGTKYIPNPDKRVMGKDGKPLNFGLFLRDLKGNIVANLNEDPTYGLWVDYGLPVTSDEEYIYAPCNERAHPIGLAHIVCRYRLDGQPHRWEEVFRFNLPVRLKRTIVNIAVSVTGDVYFCLSGRVPHQGIWKFEARTGNITQLTSPPDLIFDGAPQVSPDGHWINFSRPQGDSYKLMLLQVAK